MTIGLVIVEIPTEVSEVELILAGPGSERKSIMKSRHLQPKNQRKDRSMAHHGISILADMRRTRARPDRAAQFQLLHLRSVSRR